VAKNILTDRLRRLVDEGLLEKRPYQTEPLRHEYLLTDKGRDLQPVVIALTDWGDRYAAPNGPPIFLEHGTCGGAIHQQIRCANCGDLDNGANIVYRPGPGM
jgi:DNA-binding MarR family transcriptional regulator